ncbi:hypothetical protein ACKWTF_002181 [Chironomus riparius]
MKMNKLPKNILEQIFCKLSIQDLINISLVCKKFNKIINNSSLILNKFEILISDYEIRKWIGSRKYQKIYIEDCREDRLIEHGNVFKSIHDSVNEVAIRNLYETDLDNFILFIDQFENLTKLSIFSLNLYEECGPKFNKECQGINFKFLKYLTFCQSDVSLLKLFMNSQLSFFKISDDFGDRRILKNFLVEQKELKTLELSYYEQPSDIFNNEEILNVKFKLKKLIIDEEKIEESAFVTLQKFLTIHADTLEFFEVYEENYTIISYLKDFVNLKTLRIFGGSENIQINLPQMMNIEHLILDSKVDHYWSIFPNLISLITNSRSIDFKNIDKLQKLQNFEATGFCDIPIFNNRNIKSMKLVDCSFQNVRKFNFDNNKLEALVIENCFYVDWLEDFLLHKDQKLKVLKIYYKQNKQDKLTQELINAVNIVKNKIHVVISPLCK